MSNGINDNTIVLDLNNLDFESDISGSNIWQKDAVNEFTRFLSKTASQAQKRERDRKECDTTIIHDAIFIGGARGTGKTVFLQNIKGFWDNSTENKDTELTLHFCKSIDPTLLVDHDNFTNVVIAHLYNEVEQHIEKQCCDDKNYEGFYQALKNVCQALGKQENLGEGIGGLDRVIKYRSGIKLIQLFETFLRRSIKVLGVKAIVLPIDDIDMALERSHEILDVVRRMLASHLIIPVITGDLELYEPIITHRFLKGDNPLMKKDMIKLEQAEGLTNAYLTKVLPHHNRINLVPIDRLLPDLGIIPIGKSNYDYKSVNPPGFTPDFTNKLESTLFGPLNGEEKSRDWPKPGSAREVTQLIRDLSIENLTQLTQSELWLRYKSWAYLKQDDVAYSTAVSCHQIIDLRKGDNNFVTLNKLHSFNPIQQMNDITPKFNGKKFFAEQVITHNLEKSALLGKEMAAHLNELSHVEIYRSMPPIEIFSSKFSISHQAVKSVFDNTEDKNDDDNKRNRVLLDLFTFTNYYDLALKTIRQVFFSRAFDVLSSSLLNYEKALTKEKTHTESSLSERESRLIFWNKVLTDIFKTAPFYSMPALFPTKAFNVNVDLSEEDDDSNDNDSNDNELEKATIEYLSKTITVWEETYSGELSSYPSESLQSLLFSVFNKSFTQLKILRQKVESPGWQKDETDKEALSDLALRFKYITLNAFASLIKPTPVVLQNIAITPNVSTIRSQGNYRKVSPSLRHNIGHFFTFSSGNIKNEIEKKAEKNKNLINGGFGTLKDRSNKNSKLMLAIVNHPIFSLMNDISISEGIFKLNFTIANNLTFKKLTHNQINKINERIQSGRRLTKGMVQHLLGIKEADIKDWADIDRIKAKENGYENCDTLKIPREKLEETSTFKRIVKGL